MNPDRWVVEGIQTPGFQKPVFLGPSDTHVLHGAEWTCIATRADSWRAGRAQIPNPFVAKWFGFPSSAWARQIYLLPGQTLEPDSDGAPGPAVGVADFTVGRVGDRSGGCDARLFLLSLRPGRCGEKYFLPQSVPESIMELPFPAENRVPCP
jgi:hypothetical protein